jgi:ABC-type transport system involved in cytochrome c biogenesis permease subunit
MRHFILSFALIIGLAATATGAQMICPLNGEDLKPQGLRSFEVLKRFPVLEDGRVKPLDTYARTVLVQFSGRQSFNRKPAIEWFAQLLFAADSTKNDKIFLINNPAIPSELGLEVDKHRRYSFAQLEKKIDKLSELAQSAVRIPEKERDVVEAEIIRVYDNLRLYVDLSHVFEFAFPSAEFTIQDPAVVQRLGLPQGQEQFSFLDIAFVADPMREVLDSVKDRSSSQWTPSERKTIEILSNLFHWSLLYKNLPLAIIPSGEDHSRWDSPWDALASGFHGEAIRTEMNALRNMVVSYWNGEQIQFDVSARLYLSSIRPRLGKHPQKVVDKINLEATYNRADLFFYAKIFYFFAFILFLCSLVWARPFLYKFGLSLTLGGFILHVFAIGMRIAILARPPVSNLYETFIFVGAVVVLLGLTIERINKNWLGIVTASVGGFALLMIAAKYSAEGDTLKMLIAVLNSNFWLSTHVISITAGYGSTCAAGILGHVYLLQAIFKKKDAKLLDTTYKTLIGMLGLALTLTFLGTNLGGIWADQSWGRFWGWDPKENGALMIVIWTALLFHARIAKMIGPVGLAVGAVLGTIVVMWAWFGVNLLSIGLHSYGFTSGIATALAVYVAAELIFLGVTIFWIRKR